MERAPKNFIASFEPESEAARFARGRLLRRLTTRNGGMEYVKVARLEELEDCPYKSLKLFGRLVAIVKKDDGSLFAIESACKHHGADLMENYTGGSVVECPRHQWRYDLESGACLSNNSPPLRHYELKIEDGTVFISIAPKETVQESQEDSFDWQVEWLKKNH